MDRRQHSRLVPDSPVVVRIGDHSGRLSDLSEGGLAINGRFPATPQEAFYLHLDLFEDRSPVHAVAQTTWSSESENRTGMRFLNLADHSRQQLLEWISSRTAPPMRYPALLRPAGLLLGTVALCSISGAVCYRLGARSADRRPSAISLREVTPRATAESLSATANSESSAGSPASAIVPSSSMPPPSVNPLDTPGFILQVAAMSLEHNADALTESLQKQDIPAFVFKRGSDRLYKVAVGSFPDADSASAFKRQLETQGFTPILKPWSPQ